jgi:hypothetical protein
MTLKRAKAIRFGRPRNVSALRPNSLKEQPHKKLRQRDL